jgi:hypothetical protein
MGMSRAIAGDAELMKEIAYFARNDAFEFQAPEEIGLLFLGRSQQSRLRGRELGKDFAELAKLE